MTIYRQDTPSSGHDSTDVTTTPQKTLKSMDSSPNVAALLLTNVAMIASNELNHSVLTKPILFDPLTMMAPTPASCPRVVPGELTCACLHHDYGRSNTPPSVISSSEDDENHSADSSLSGEAAILCRPTSCPSAVLTKSTSPLLSSTRANYSNEDRLVQTPRVVREVLSKKFSWKHYPEVSL